jgi:hypothetical protein
MYKRIALVGMLFVGSVHAMEHGQTLQIVVNTPVAKTLRWLSSGRPEANIAAGAIAVCLAKSGFDLVAWPMRALWGRTEEHCERGNVGVCATGCQLGGNSDVSQKLRALTDRLVALESSRPASIDENKHYEDLLRRLKDLEGRPCVTVQEVGALRAQMQALETRRECSCADDIKTLGDRFDALSRSFARSKEPVSHLDVASVELDGSVQVRVKSLEEKLSAFEKQNTTEHASIRKDNLHQFTQALERLTERVSVTESQLKALQERAQLITSVKQ